MACVSLKYPPHLRHTFATHMLDSGADLGDSGNSRPCQPVHHPGIYPCEHGSPDGSVRQSPSPTLTIYKIKKPDCWLYLTANSIRRNGYYMDNQQFHGTTILAVRTQEMVVVAGDGQVTLGHVVTKHKARKVRRIYNDRIITGFAGPQPMP